MTSLRDLEPIQLSRELKTAAERYFAFRRGLKHSPASLHPFGREEFPGLSHLRFVENLPEGDPLRSQLMRWVYFLLDARIQVPFESHEAELIYRRPHRVKEPREGAFSLSELTKLALDGSQGEPAAFWRQRGRFEAELSDHRRQLLYRREEVAERAAFRDRAAFFNPLSGAGLPADLAESALHQTRDFAESQWDEGFAAFVEAALGRGATEGWPARLTPDSLRELFGQSLLFRGVNVQLGSLPLRLCPMSFVRAAAALGRSLSRSLAACDLPFVIARDPHDLPGKRMGELFGLWTMSEPFLRKRLKLSSSQAKEASRWIRRAHVCHVRLLATKVIVREAARTQALAEKWGAMSFMLCREELPPSAALARFDVPDDSDVRLVAHLSAVAWNHELMETYDEDWYQNPRAQEEIREGARRPAFARVSASECEGSLDTLEKLLRQ